MSLQLAHAPEPYNDKKDSTQTLAVLYTEALPHETRTKAPGMSKIPCLYAPKHHISSLRRMRFIDSAFVIVIAKSS